MKIYVFGFYIYFVVLENFRRIFGLVVLVLVYGFNDYIFKSCFDFEYVKKLYGILYFYLGIEKGL